MILRCPYRSWSGEHLNTCNTDLHRCGVCYGMPTSEADAQIKHREWLSRINIERVSPPFDDKELAMVYEDTVQYFIEQSFIYIDGIDCIRCGRLHDRYASSYITVPANVSRSGEEEYYCSTHLLSIYFICCLCGEIHRRNSSRRLYNYPELGTGLVCSVCVEKENLWICSHCGNVFFEWEEYLSHQVAGHICCNNCYTYQVTLCDHCGEDMFITDGQRVISRGNDLIFHQHCFEEVRDNYYQCDSCGAYVASNYYTTEAYDGVCISCYESIRDSESYDDDYDDDNENDSRIHQYSYTPKYILSSSSLENPNIPRLYFGIELEVDVDRSYSISDACDIVDRYENFYMKSDGSIDRGFEIVSHPGTLMWWHENKDVVKELFSKLHMCDAYRNGLHVHISKGGMSSKHSLRFQSFFDANHKQIEVMARRPQCHWAEYQNLKHKEWSDAVDDSNKYRAVNWSHGRTVEIRIFRGTLDVGEFYTAIEFCHAVYQFTKTQISIASIAHGNSWKMFVKYIKDNKRYKNLNNFINRKLKEV